VIYSQLFHLIFVAVRTLLSALYVSKKDAEIFTKSSFQSEEIALQTLTLDRCHERDMPVSSLLIDRLIRAINSKEHLKGSLYYLFKYALLYRLPVSLFVNKPKYLGKFVILNRIE